MNTRISNKCFPTNKYKKLYLLFSEEFRRAAAQIVVSERILRLMDTNLW